MRDLEDTILNYVALDQAISQMRADMALSVILQMLGWSQREIADVGGRNQKGIGYHVAVAKRVVKQG